jgi:hypothetical protein
MEEWKLAIETYEISNFGNCRKKLKNGNYVYIKGSLLNPITVRSSTYRYFQLQRDKKRTNHLFHHLVAYQFIGERPEGMVIDHIDRNSLNNHVSNLRYITPKENTHNSDRYRSDIVETDARLRKNILTKELQTKKRRERGAKEIRPKGTGQLYKTKSDSWKAVIVLNKVKYQKTLKTREEAEIFLQGICNEHGRNHSEPKCVETSQEGTEALH